MGDPAIAPNERYTYRHYLTWPDEERWELIEGCAWAMSPAPSWPHQRLVGRLHAQFYAFMDKKPGQVVIAPFDVLLPSSGEEDGEVDTVVQPDISVFCDESKIRKSGARGAPDLVVELLSPSTSKKDQDTKFRLYEKHAVREYWIIDPLGAWLCVYRLATTGRFDAGELREPARDYSPIASSVLEGFSVDPKELFAEN